MMTGMKGRQYAAVLCASLALVCMVWALPPVQSHSLEWYVGHTPSCWGPVCVNVFPDHVALEFHWS